MELTKKDLNRKDIKLTLTLTIISLIGILVTVLYQIDTLPPEMIVLPKELLIVISTIQSTVLVAVLCFLGLKLARATNFNKGFLGHFYSKKSSYKLDKNSVIIALISAFIYAALIVVSDKFLWGNFIPEVVATEHVFNPLYLFAGLLYGGVVEEIMLRLFGTSLIVFILYKIFARNKSKEEIPTSFYIIGIVLAAILFGIGHLPANFALFGTSAIVASRSIIMNAIPGLIFGYLYWKKGLEYAMLSHMFGHVFMQLVWFPLLF